MKNSEKSRKVMPYRLAADQEFRIHVLHTGAVCISPKLAFGGEDCSAIDASGLFLPKKDRIWLPVSVYLIETRHGLILFDCGWNRTMSPEGRFDKKAQIDSLHSRLLYAINQGIVPKGRAVDERLESMGISPRDLDLVLLSHLDCDHANGLSLLKEAKDILVSQKELESALMGGLENKIRFQPAWWEDTGIHTFSWNDTQGPAGKSFDVFRDGSVEMINIPGHTEGLCALKLKNKAGKFVLLVADGGYAKKSWQDMIQSGIAVNRKKQKESLEWIREQAMDPDCLACLANHDPQVKEQIIEL